VAKETEMKKERERKTMIIKEEDTEMATHRLGQLAGLLGRVEDLVKED
jgi:hypothetical protein